MAEKKIESWLDEGDTTSEILVEEPKIYEKKVVAWLDILGIRAMIKKEEENSAQDIITLMRTLRSFVVQECGRYEEEHQMDSLQIADGFMIASTIDRINELCEAIATIQWRILTELNMLARGAITIGNVSVADEGTIIIGPAYVDAYALESENAYFARTVVSSEFISNSKDLLDFEFIVEDADKTNYIDYVGFAQKKEGKTAEELSRLLENNGCIDFLQNGFHNDNVSIRQKYGWTIALLQKHNAISLNI